MKANSHRLLGQGAASLRFQTAQVLKFSPLKNSRRTYLFTRIFIPEALRLNPNDADAHCLLGFALEHKRNSAEALQKYRAAYQLDPHDPRIPEGLRAPTRQDSHLTVGGARHKSWSKIETGNPGLHKGAH
jgi:tetratricopeptide (TPR) repeat protein